MSRIAIVVGVVAASLSACGSSALEKPGLAKAADAICANYEAKWSELGMRGLSNPGIAAEMSGYHDVGAARLTRLKALRPAEDIAKPWSTFVSASQTVVDADAEIAKAARSGDTDAVNAGFDRRSSLLDARDAAGKPLGLNDCVKPRPAQVGDSGTAPDPAADWVKPTNSVKDAAQEWLAAVASKDCAQINATRHSDATAFDDDACANVVAAVDGAKVVRTEEYGPVGVAELVAADGTHVPTTFVLDADGKQHMASDGYHDFGGLRAAPEKNDAAATYAAFIAAVKTGEVAEVNKSIWDDGPDVPGIRATGDRVDALGDGPLRAAVVDAIKQVDGRPARLGLDAAGAYYLVPGTTDEKPVAHDWVISLGHWPGRGGHYLVNGYWPIPRP